MALGWRNQYTRYKDFFLNVYDSYTKRAEARMFIEILLSVVVSTFFVFLALRPTIVTILELVKTIQEKEKVVEQLEQKIENLNTAKQVYDQNSSKITLLASAVPDIPEPEVLSRQLQGLAQQSSVEVTSLAVEEASLLGHEQLKEEKGVESLPSGANPLTFSFNVKSSNFPLVSDLLNGLKNLRIPIKLDSFSISSLASEETVNLILVVGGRSPYLSNNQGE